MNLQWLGRFAMLGAPFLLIDFLVNGMVDAPDKSALSGFCCLLFISGWMCSIIGLWQLEAAGSSPWARMVLLLQLLFLSLANVSNVLMLLQIGIGTRLFVILDEFWPISNIWMLVTGIMVLTAMQLHGWMRVVPFLAALWLPLALFLFSVIMGGTRESMLFSGAYSATAWMLMAYVVFKLGTKPQVSNAFALS